MRNKKAIAARLAKELEQTRALQPRLKREMYQRQAASASRAMPHSMGNDSIPKALCGQYVTRDEYKREQLAAVQVARQNLAEGKSWDDPRDDR